ncbi:DDE_3 domain-containing protein [Trichonephila clavipes]|nr:DDE_3 domain-containing protein [Trichonephila clavipes]
MLQQTWTARSYVDKILMPVVLPRCPQDNARLHTTRLSLQCLQGYDVHLWSAGSPDLSPVKYLLGRQLSPSQNAVELTTQFQRLRHDLPQEVFVTSH